MAGALEVVRHGVVVVACESMVVNLNSAAETSFATTTGSAAWRAGSSRRVRIVTSNSTWPFGMPWSATIHRRVPVGPSSVIDRPESGPDVVHVLPSHQRADNLAAGRPMGLALIVDPEDELEPASDLLRRLFNLTEAEAEVALHMVRGADLKQVAEDLSVSLATVRTHLHHVFDKTQTHRQAELVRLLLALCP